MPTRSRTRERAARLLLDDGIARLALLALSERDVQRLLEHAVVCIAEALAVDHAQVFELLPDGSTLVSRASLASDRRTLNRVGSGQPTGSQASFTLHAGTPVISVDLARESRFRPSRLQRTVGVVTAVSVPLLGRSAQPYGVLEIGSSSRLSVPPEIASDFLQGAGHLLVPGVERARVEAACRFLAESQARLVSADDFRGSVIALAELPVPELGDWCCIDIVLPSGDIECVALSHTDAGVAQVATRLRSRLKANVSAEVGIANVVRTGCSEFHFDLGAALSVGQRQAKTLDALAAAAGFRAAIVTPLTARGHIFGAVTLVTHSARRFFDQGDVMLAEAFATHAGLALDNVRLFFGKDRVAATLPRVAGVTSGIALLDPEVVATRLLGTMAEERNRLARVVDSVMLANGLGSPAEGPAADTCDAVEVVRGVVETIRASLPRAWSLEFEQPSLSVASDADTIRQIATALVENAVLYSPDGGSIAVRLEACGTSIRLAVDDNGIGIDPDERELVFEKFHRGKGAHAIGTDGVGLGLYICRELASRLKGRVEIVDTREQGTTVFVELPLAAPERNDLQLQEGNRLTPAPRGRSTKP